MACGGGVSMAQAAARQSCTCDDGSAIFRRVMCIVDGISSPRHIGGIEKDQTAGEKRQRQQIAQKRDGGHGKRRRSVAWYGGRRRRKA